MSLLFSEFKFKWLAEETRKNLPVELDFVNEAKNCERVDKMLSHFDFLKVCFLHYKSLKVAPLMAILQFINRI